MRRGVFSSLPTQVLNRSALARRPQANAGEGNCLRKTTRETHRIFAAIDSKDADGIPAKSVSLNSFELFQGFLAHEVLEHRP